MPGIGIGISPAFQKPINWASYWANSGLFLFFGEYSKITGGRLYNQVTGSTDWLTVAGVAGSETYQTPNTPAYIAADINVINTSDYIWFKTDASQRTTTTAELIGYDFTRTLVKYADIAPYAIDWIAILNVGVTVTDAMRDSFHLSVFWDNVLNAHGYVKGNRGMGQSVWTPELVFPDNCMGYWKLDEAAGNLVNSVTPGTYDGVPTNITQNQTGKINKCCKFVKAISKIECGAIAGETIFSVSIWVKRVAIVVGTFDWLFSSALNYAGAIFYDDGHICGIDDTGSVLTTLGAIGLFTDSTAFHHMVINVSVIGDATHGKWELFFDGVSQGIKTGKSNNLSKFTIGGVTNQGMTNGLLDEVALFTDNLTQDDIDKLYNSGAGYPYPY